MSVKKRIDTLRVIVDANADIQNSGKLTAITGELQRITHASRMPRQNGWLLSVLHTTRALDTSLQVVVAAKGWTPTTPSLGQYFKCLVQNGVMQQAEHNAWTASVVHKRNKYMHAAGAMPDQIEADQILSEMQACLTVVLSRV